MTYGVPLLSLDHFFSCDNLLIRNIPFPWAEKRKASFTLRGKNEQNANSKNIAINIA